MNAPELHLPHLSASLHSDGLVLNETAADHYCGVGLLYAVIWSKNVAALGSSDKISATPSDGAQAPMQPLQAMERLARIYQRG